jgi:cbb3-type cytochrome oxidase maturation protein
MNGLIILIPSAICLGLLALVTFLWALRTGQYEDLKGAAERILDEEPVHRSDDPRP